MKPYEIRAELSHCYGSDQYYRHFGGLCYTDGIKTLATLCGAYWLIDAIASHQPRCRRDPMLREMQFWTLKKKADDTWELGCERDSGDVAFRQKIEFSDFPLDEIKIYVQQGVMLLPSEY